jgi:hypothetical protein
MSSRKAVSRAPSSSKWERSVARRFPCHFFSDRNNVCAATNNTTAIVNRAASVTPWISGHPKPQTLGKAAPLAARDGISAQQLAGPVLNSAGRITSPSSAWETKQRTQVHTNRFGAGQHLITQAGYL